MVLSCRETRTEGEGFNATCVFMRPILNFSADVLRVLALKPSHTQKFELFVIGYCIVKYIDYRI